MMMNNLKPSSWVEQCFSRQLQFSDYNKGQHSNLGLFTYQLLSSVIGKNMYKSFKKYLHLNIVGLNDQNFFWFHLYSPLTNLTDSLRPKTRLQSFVEIGSRRTLTLIQTHTHTQKRIRFRYLKVRGYSSLRLLIPLDSDST